SCAATRTYARRQNVQCRAADGADVRANSRRAATSRWRQRVGDAGAAIAQTAYSGSPPPGDRSSARMSVQPPVASKYVRTSATCWTSVVPSHTATAFVGKQRFESDTTKGAAVLSTRRTSRNAWAGCRTYWIDTAHI